MNGKTGYTRNTFKLTLPFQPYQYFAYDCQKVFGMKERELGEQDEYGVRRHPDEDVICTSKYSFLEPAQGGEVIYKVSVICTSKYSFLEPAQGGDLQGCMHKTLYSVYDI